jgi:hypothetical protein
MRKLKSINSKIDKRLHALGIEDIELCEGIVIHSKLRLKTERALEKYFGHPAYSWGQTLDPGNTDTAVMFIYHLALQRYEAHPEQYDEKITEAYIMEKMEDAKIEGIDVHMKFINVLMKMRPIGKSITTDEDPEQKTDESKTVDIKEVTETNVENPQKPDGQKPQE